MADKKIKGICSLLCLSSLSLNISNAESLPDTGQILCYNDISIVDCSIANTADTSTHPSLDARYGRDAAAVNDHLNKLGDGDAGFDYTKVCNSGELAGEGSCPSDPILGSGDNEWGCTKDNITSLMWEVKTDDEGLRDKDWTYSWYSDAERSDGTSGALNAGNAGSENSGTCYNKFDGEKGNYCDTAGYVAAVNGTGLCGANDWRVPKASELHLLVNFGKVSPAIDTTFFPNTANSSYWTANSRPHPNYSAFGTKIYFSSGAINSVGEKSYGYKVRLVRGELTQSSPDQCKAGTPNSLLLVDTPTSDFTVSVDQKTVTHNLTNLTWDRCPFGMVLDDNGTIGIYSDDKCTGSAAKRKWSAAQVAALNANTNNYLSRNDWRIPNVKELRSIVESCGNLSINFEIFPDTVIEPTSYWTSTSSVNDANNAWDVSFGGGASYDNSYDSDKNYIAHYVRFVSGGNLAAYDLLEEDSDGDGISDGKDNCLDIQNSDQKNSDQDSFGDACDYDDDNDGLFDEDELFLGTDLTKVDSDSDGINDYDDNFPLQAGEPDRSLNSADLGVETIYIVNPESQAEYSVRTVTEIETSKIDNQDVYVNSEYLTNPSRLSTQAYVDTISGDIIGLYSSDIENGGDRELTATITPPIIGVPANPFIGYSSWVTGTIDYDLVSENDYSASFEAIQAIKKKENVNYKGHIIETYVMESQLLIYAVFLSKTNDLVIIRNVTKVSEWISNDLGTLKSETTFIDLQSNSESHEVRVLDWTSLDDDSDGVSDTNDFYPTISLNGLLDTDNDGIPNNCDASCKALGMVADDDDDGDGYSDLDEIAAGSDPLDPKSIPKRKSSIILKILPLLLNQ